MSILNLFHKDTPKPEDYGETQPAPGRAAPAGSSINRNDSGSGAAVGGGRIENFDETTPIPPGSGRIPEYPPTVPSHNRFSFEEIRPTEPAGSVIRSGDEASASGAAEPAGARLPLAGWLVCVEGPEKGKDFRIHAENNFIGRLESNDICLAKDSRVSRERHAMLTYDAANRKFYLGTQEGTNIVRLNGTPLMDARELQAYDQITVGVTKLLFIPFCGEKFAWDT